MSFLRGSGAANAQPAYVPEYTGLQIQTSTNGVPIPILYGVNKISFNLIWQGGFFANPQYTKTSSGGKGGHSSSQVSGYQYYTALILGLCEGPVTTVSQTWAGTSVGIPGDLSLSFFSGTTPQAPWSFLSTYYSSQSLPYGGLAYLSAPQFYLGADATLPSLTFEVYGFLSSATTSAVVNGYDADPALVIQDFLTSSQYGVGFPPASIDTTTLLGASGDSSYQTYCRAAGLALSPAIVNQETASSIMTRWLRLTNTAAIWSGGKLKFLPYGDTSITGTLHGGGLIAFNPNTLPIYNLTDDDFVHDDDSDPVQITRSDPFTAKNWRTMEIAQRSVAYSSVPIEAWDQNAIELYGLRKGSTVTAHEICDPAVAQISLQLILQRDLNIRNAYAFKLSFEYCLLEPMDIVALTDAGLGLNSFPVRITSIEEDDAGLLSVTAEDFLIGSAMAAVYQVPISNGVGYDSGVAASPVNPPIIFEPGPSLTDETSQVWIAISGGNAGVADPNWGGAIVNISLDNATYGQIGMVKAPTRQGVLTASLAAPSGGNPDTTNTLAVSLAESGGALPSVSNLDAQSGVTLLIVDQELLAYAAATLTGSNAYNLTYLERGLHGTTAAAHSSGAPFARLDDAIFKYDLPPACIGVKLYFKFQSFNIWGEAVENISTCAVYTYTPTGAGYEGPVASALAVGSNLDYGLAGASINETDDFGLASDSSVTIIDLGLASA